MPACNHQLNFPAIRAFNRAFRPINEAYDVSCAMDYGFDAGEFSGSAIARSFDREMERVAKQVADRYGMDPETLLSQALTCYPMHEQDVLISKNLL